VPLELTVLTYRAPRLYGFSSVRVTATPTRSGDEEVCRRGRSGSLAAVQRSPERSAQLLAWAGSWSSSLF